MSTGTSAAEHEDASHDRAGRGRVLITFLRGLFALGLAVALVLGGENAGRTLGNFIGMYFLADGAASLRYWLGYERRDVLPGLAGALGVLAGVVTVGRLLLAHVVPLSTALQVVGMLALLMGWTRVIGGFNRPETAHRFRMLEAYLLGGFELLLGVVLIIAPPTGEPGAHHPGLMALLVGWALVGAAILLTDAWRGRSALRSGPTTRLA